MQTDIRSGIYSFGVVLSWLLTGKEEPIQNPQFTLERIAAKSCAYAPDSRYQDDAALLRALRKTTREYVRKRKKGFSGGGSRRYFSGAWLDRTDGSGVPSRGIRRGIADHQ